jgi:RimJ/RimL family protein N-acetyltransferase
MEVQRPTDPAEFLEMAEPLLAASEARHNLIYGIGGVLVSDPGHFEEFRLWLGVEGGRPVAAALRTPPFGVVVGDAATETAARQLAAAVSADEVELPTATGNVPTIKWFVDEWRTLTGADVRRSMAQGVFVLEEVRPLPPGPGRARPAEQADRDLLVEWAEAFTAEAVHDEPPQSRERTVALINRRIAGIGGSGIWVWEVDGEPVAMSGHGGLTPNGIRIGLVYTPPAHRRNGYATALVAAQSASLLTHGRTFCFLFTDLANPTSNAIYQRIGYEQVAEAALYTLGSPAE